MWWPEGGGGRVDTQSHSRAVLLLSDPHYQAQALAPVQPALLWPGANQIPLNGHHFTVPVPGPVGGGGGEVEALQCSVTTDLENVAKTVNGAKLSEAGGGKRNCTFYVPTKWKISCLQVQIGLPTVDLHQYHQIYKNNNFWYKVVLLSYGTCLHWR